MAGWENNEFKEEEIAPVLKTVSSREFSVPDQIVQQALSGLRVIVTDTPLVVVGSLLWAPACFFSMFTLDQQAPGLFEHQAHPGVLC